MPDQDLARKLGRGLDAVRARRNQLKRQPCNPKWVPWTAEELALLGKFPVWQS